MKRILLIEDDDALRKLLKVGLENLGYFVEEAGNGNQALECYAANPADVVITDLIMPEKEGLETIAELKQKNPQVKIIAMSGGGRINAVDYLAIAEKMGAQRVLSKPFSTKQMADALKDVLRH